MPHLSPMSWFITPLILWGCLALLWSLYWWALSPKFPPLSKTSLKPPSNPFWVW